MGFRVYARRAPRCAGREWPRGEVLNDCIHLDVLAPVAAEEAIEQLERNLQALQTRSPTTLVREGQGARGMLELLLDGLDARGLRCVTLSALEGMHAAAQAPEATPPAAAERRGGT